jgi:hypothetical protein
MANAYRVSAGKNVAYLDTSGRWRSAKITSVTDQNNVVLAIIDSVTNSRTRVALNGGVAVPKRTNGTQTNVWRQNS